MKRARLVPIALALCAGITCDLHGIGLPALLLGALLACVARTPAAVVRSTAVAALAIGIADAALFGHLGQARDDRHTATYDARIVERQAAAFDASGEINAELRLDDGRTVEAYLRSDGPPFAIGEGVRVRGRVVVLDDARNPGEASPRELARERGVDGRLAHPSIITRRGVDTSDASLWLARARDAASRSVHASLPEPEASILAGALWGERGTLPRDLRDEFQDTGTVHVLVTAGLHLGVVAWLGLTLLRAGGVGRITSSLITITLVWFYAEFSGAHLPSLRAATMLSFALIARASGREAYLPNALAAAAIVVALARPQAVDTLSFALSFSCVAAIAVFAEPIARALERHGVPPFAREALALSFATQLGTWPLTASAFLVIAPYAPIANALVVPVVGVAMLVGLAALAANPIAPLAHALCSIDDTLLAWIVGVVRLVARAPGAHVIATPPPDWTIATYDLALVAVAMLVHHRRRGVAACVFAASCALCLWPPRDISLWPPRIGTNDLRITAIDVGQADALLVQTPHGRAFLIDAGGRLERGAMSNGDSRAEAIGERVVVPFLIRAGVHHLDAILLSHPHGDHAGGIAPVLRTLGANAFADSGQSYPGHAYHDALDVARERHITMLEPRGGDVWRTDDGVTFHFYGPTIPYITGSRSDINSNSLVFRLEYGSFRMLFMGDAGRETEERLLAAHADLRADILKVGHHGSAYGTTPDFVNAVAPRDAVISVGRHNLFGHPAPSTLALLHDAGVATYRTDRDGAVTISSDGQRFTVEAYR